ncbi:hypothetical protein GALMADRAFT_227707 [Galerina marginata CBS 339.88]|uniref:KA1 domain-containing protein n=1 Tax=Galerina marginata (strain CBS 339.88) TaxID=685588 RepID=A0A067T4R9_GALM3|nr:hypothetical protein GALMADRAFT_227707 [Galerina marginata CBS 339.88]
MLRGLLMRRQSSQVSSHNGGGGGLNASQPSLAFDDDTSVIVGEPLHIDANANASSPLSPVPPSGLGFSAHPQGPVYGDPSQDAGDEVRFSVELTRLDRLNDTYSLDIRRLKGNLRSYKFLYDTLRDRADLSASQG